MIKNIALVLLALAGLFYLLDKNFPNVLANKQNYLYIAQIALVLAVIVFSVAKNGVDIKFVLSATIRWLFVALVLLSGYSYRYALQSYYQTILGQIAPSVAVEQRDGSVVFHASSNGHFQINAEVNGATVSFLLDTGATRVALTAADATRAGFDVNALEYNVSISTANGSALFAAVTIPEIKVGPIVVCNVDAYIGKSGLDSSLLGMSFLSRLKEYEVTQNTLTMRGDTTTAENLVQESTSVVENIFTWFTTRINSLMKAQ